MIEKKVEIIEKNGINYEKATIIEVKEDGTEVVRGVVETPVQAEPVTPEPTQFDRIESAVLKSQEQIAQEARDAYTLELINSGII